MTIHSHHYHFVLVMALTVLASTPSRHADAKPASFPMPAWSDLRGWDDPSCYETIQVGDVTGDGQQELIGRCAAGVNVSRYDAETGVWTPLLFELVDWRDANGWGDAIYYQTIQTGDITGDGKAELIGRGASGLEFLSYQPNNINAHFGAFIELTPGPTPHWSDDHHWNHPQYYETIQTADLTGDGRDELIGRSADGIVAYSYVAGLSGAAGGSWKKLPDGPDLSDAAGWDGVAYYATIQTADITGDGRAELLARSDGGIHAYSFVGSIDDGQWKKLPDGPAWSNAKGWDQANCYRTIQTADLTGDGRAELIGRCNTGVSAYRYEPASGTTAGAWTSLPPGPQWSDDGGWKHEEYYLTIHAGDLTGDGRADLISRESPGLYAYTYISAADRPTQGAWRRLPRGPAWSDVAGWNAIEYFATIRIAAMKAGAPSVLVGRGHRGIGSYAYQQNVLPCAKGVNRTQVWRLRNASSGSVVFNQIGAWNRSASRFDTYQPDDGVYLGTPSYQVAVSASVLRSGESGYVALCASDFGEHEKDGSMYVDYVPAAARANVSALIRIAFDGTGATKVVDSPYQVDSLTKTITIGTNLVLAKPTGVSAEGTWSRTPASFPAFAGAQLVAYRAIPRAMNLVSEIRSLYGRDAATLQTYVDNLRTLGPPAQVQPQAWSVVKKQVLAELNAAVNVAGAFESNRTTINTLFLSSDLNLDVVGNALEIAQDSSDKVTVGIADMLEGLIKVSDLSLASTVYSVIATMLSSALTVGSELGLPSTVSGEYVDLKAELSSSFAHAVTGNDQNHIATVSNYGLLRTVGSLLNSGFWVYDSSATAARPALAKGRRAYARSLWKALVPLVWYTTGTGRCGKYDFSQGGVGANGLADNFYTSTCPDDALLKTVFGETSSDCQKTFSAECALHVPKREVYEDWGLHMIPPD